MKEQAKLVQQKSRPVPMCLKESVGKEIDKLMKHIEKANNIDENGFVSLAVKKDKKINIALDSRKLNKITIKRKAQMPNMEELNSRKIADGPADEIWISKFDVDYAYGQILLFNDA